MCELNLKKRLVFDNIYLMKGEKYVLLNLFSFRRRTVTKKELLSLFSSQEKMEHGFALSEHENGFYQQMLSEKQILPPSLLSEYNEKQKELHYGQISKIKIPISTITISPTFSCNFSCKYCYQKDFQAKRDFLLPIHVDAICDALKKINKTNDHREGIVAVNINGGEALQEKNIPTINRIIEKFKSEKIRLGLYTNGFNILRFKDEVDFSKFNSVQVSLDGMDCVAEPINGVRTEIFQNVTSGILYLLSLGVWVKIAVMLSRPLVDCFSEFVFQLKKLGISEHKNVNIEVSLCLAFGKSTLDETFMTFEEYITLKQKIEQVHLGKNWHISGIHETRWITRAMKKAHNERMTGNCTMCSIMKNRSLHFAPNGKIYWCICVEPESGVLGQFFPNFSFETELLTNCIKKSVYTVEKCKNCKYMYICSGGCPLNALKQNGKYNSDFCGFFEDERFWENLEQLI